MSAERTVIFDHGRGQQQGAALLTMLVILVVGIAAVLVNSLNSSTVKTARQETTAAALAQAKDALIGYATIYGDTHSGEVHGYLPCPDTNGSPEGSSTTPCGTQNTPVIGRLPWRTQDLSVLSDGNGECLWYAVSGTYKNLPKTNLMNWDTNGQFLAYASDGALLTPPDNQVAAVIFAPSAAQSGQSRAGTTFPVCGGNYTAANYLDNDTVHSINNSDVTTGKFIQGTSIGINNDQMLFITRQDIWNAIKKRNNFDTYIATLLSAAKACLTTHPTPVTIDFGTMNEAATSAVGSMRIGRIPVTALNSCANNNLVKQWRDNLLYAICTSAGCLPGGDNGVIIFAGEKNTSLGQQRITNTDKNTWNNYLEDTPYTILTTFSSGAITFPGASSYSASSPSADAWDFIP